MSGDQYDTNLTDVDERTIDEYILSREEQEETADWRDLSCLSQLIKPVMRQMAELLYRYRHLPLGAAASPMRSTFLENAVANRLRKVEMLRICGLADTW